MDYKHEYGRYKKKVDDQQKAIREMEEQAQGWQDAIRGTHAIMVAILEVTGSVTVSMDRVRQLIAEGTVAPVHVDFEKREYTFGAEKPDEDL